MTQKEFDDASARLLAEADRIQRAKRPGYTMGNRDVLHNFKQVAARSGIATGQAWAVYFLKHVDAITTIMTRPDLPVSEAPLGRFADGINYLLLGWGVLEEGWGGALRLEANQAIAVAGEEGPLMPLLPLGDMLARG